MNKEIDKVNNEKPSAQTQQDGSHTDNGEWGWEALGSEDDAEVSNQPVVVVEQDGDNDGVEGERNPTQELDSPTASQSSPSGRREGGRSYFSRTSKERLRPDATDGGEYQPQQHQNSNSQAFGQRKQGQHQRNMSGVGRHSSHNLLRPSNSSGNFNNLGGGGGGKGSGKALKGITSSPSFQELEKAIALSLESNGGDGDQYMPSGSSGRLSSINITNQKIQQQQRQRQHQQQHQQMNNRFVSQNMGHMASYGSYGAGPYGQLFPGQNQLGPYFNMGMTPQHSQQMQQFSQARNPSFNNLVGMTAGANHMSMGVSLPHLEVAPGGPSAREELSAFINETESRALIIFHSPTVTPIVVRDACQKFGVLYYIRPEFHNKGVTLISYFDLRSALESHGNIANELGPDAEASAHYSVMLHAAGNAEEYRLVVRNIPEPPTRGREDSENSGGGNDSDDTETAVRSIFSRYGPLRSVQRESTESNATDSKTSTGAFSIEFYNIQDARLAGSELAATSGQSWSPETTVKFAPLDERRQLLCKQLLATLSRWRTDMAAATAAMHQMQMQQMQMQMSMPPGHSLMMMPQPHLNMNMGNVGNLAMNMNMNMGNMAQVPMAMSPMGGGMTSTLPMQLVGSNGNLAAMVHMPQFSPVMQGNTMTFFGQGPPSVQNSGGASAGSQDEQTAAASGRGSPIMTFAYGNAAYPQQVQQQQDASGQTHFFAVDVSSMNGNPAQSAFGTLSAAPIHTQLQSLTLTESQQQQLQQQQHNMQQFQQQQQISNQQQQQQQQEMQKYHQQQQQQYQQQSVSGWVDKDGQTAEKSVSSGPGKSYHSSPATRSTGAALVSGSIASAGSSSAARPYHQMQAPPPLFHQMQGPSSSLGVSRSDFSNSDDGQRTVGLEGITVAHSHHGQTAAAHHGLANNSSNHGRQGSTNAPQHAPTHHYGQPGQGSGQGQGARSAAQRHGGRNSGGQGGAGVQGQGSSGQYHLTSAGSSGVRENQIDADFALDLSRIDEEKENRTTIMVQCDSVNSILIHTCNTNSQSIVLGQEYSQQVQSADAVGRGECEP